MTELTDTTRLEQVRDFMLDVFHVSAGRGWATLSEIKEMTGVPETYVSMDLGQLREARYGGYIVERRHRENVGTYEYRVREKVKLCTSTPEGLARSLGKLDCVPLRAHARRESVSH